VSLRDLEMCGDCCAPRHEHDWCTCNDHKGEHDGHLRIGACQQFECKCTGYTPKLGHEFRSMTKTELERYLKAENYLAAGQFDGYAGTRIPAQVVRDNRRYEEERNAPKHSP
jgi:hypothetical protein